MPSNTNGSASVRCPYFKSATPLQIRCEGLTADCIIIQSFTSIAQRRARLRRHCRQAYSECPLCQALDRKYEESGPAPGR